MEKFLLLFYFIYITELTMEVEDVKIFDTYESGKY